MSALAIYMWGVCAGAVVGAVCGLMAWRNGLPLVSGSVDVFRPTNVVDLVGVILCYALMWPYLLFLGVFAAGKKLKP